MEDFVPFDLAVKLKEKGFSCEYPFAIYDEDGEFFTLYSSDKYYFEIENFDDRDFIAPTISQVLKWLREEKKIHIEVVFGCCGFCWDLILNIKYVEGYNNSEWDVLDCEKYAEINNQGNHSTYEQAAIVAIEYVIDNLL